MTKEEFIRNQKVFLKWARRVVISFCGLAILFGVLLEIVLTHFIHSTIDGKPSWFDASIHDLEVSVRVFIIAILGGVLVILSFMWRYHKKLDLACPSCRKALFHTAAQIAIASGNCGFCGSAVFSHPPSRTLTPSRIR